MNLEVLENESYSSYSSYFDNSKVILFDDWNVLFLKKNIFIVEAEISFHWSN
jgi:hypothetical protein